jgi:acyl carrier protein
MNQSETEIRSHILSLLQKRFNKLGFKEKLLQTDFDLLKTGLLDSMSFIDFIADLEHQYSIEIDFENKNPAEFTSLSGLVKLISQKLNG